MRQLHPLFILCLLFAAYIDAEISSSSELNCDFSNMCRWRNATGDSGEWTHTSRVELQPGHAIIPMRDDDAGDFTHTTGIMGRTIALLVSEVISCQLGGASLKYWYFRTGDESQLEVCIRQPPGNRDPTSLRCYDGLSSTSAQQWIFRVIQLPPASQPFELIFRAIFFPPTDIIALDDIEYEAALCDAHHGVRTARRLDAPPLIGIRDWMLLRDTEHFKGQTMIVVSERIPDTNGNHHPRRNTTTKETKKDATTTLPSTTSSPQSLELITSDVSQENITSESSSTSTSTTTTLPMQTSSEEISTTTVENNITTTEIITSAETTTTTTTTDITDSPDVIVSPSVTQMTEDPLSNFMRLFRQTAPVFPFIPALLRTLQSVDPKIQQATGRGPLDELSEITKATAGVDLKSLTNLPEIRRAPPVDASHFYNTNNVPLNHDTKTSDATLIDIARRAGLLNENDLLTTVLPPTLPPVQRNAFGMVATTLRPIKIPLTVYPPRMVPQKRAPIPRRELTHSTTTKSIDMKRLTNDEMQKLAEIHKKLFGQNMELNELSQSSTTVASTTTADLVLFLKPTNSENDVATKLTELAKILPSDAMNDMSALRDIPDLEGLTKGMDLSIIRKPGGFTLLKKQFVERLMRRTLGLPLDDPSVNLGDVGGKSLPPPIVPIKVTRKMLRERAARLAARARRKKLQIYNSGANEGGGGSFGVSGSDEPKLIDFNGGNEIALSSDFGSAQPEQFDDRSSAEARAAPQVDPSVARAPPVPLDVSSGGSTTSTLPPTPRVGAQFTSRCSLIDCTFDDETMCNYVTSSTETSQQNQVPTENLKEWIISQQPILNSLTGIPYDLSKSGGFIFAGSTTVSPLDTFVLSTNTVVEIKDNARLDFFIWQAGVRGRLRVCLNTLENCPLILNGKGIAQDARKWKNQYVDLEPGTYAIHFVADGLYENYAIGIDQIQLLNKYGMAAQQC